MENIEDKAISKWGQIDSDDEIEDEELYIFAKVAVGQSAKDLDYWANYEAEEDFRLIKKKVRKILTLKAKSRQGSDYKQLDLFDQEEERK